MYKRQLLNQAKAKYDSSDSDWEPPHLTKRGKVGYNSESSVDDPKQETKPMPKVPHGETEPAHGKVSFNSKAKEATGIDYPPEYRHIKYRKPRDLAALRRFFPGSNAQTIQKTIKATTQYATRGAIDGTSMRQQIQSPNPVLNIPRRNEDVATNTLYSLSLIHI